MKPTKLTQQILSAFVASLTVSAMFGLVAHAQQPQQDIPLGAENGSGTLRRLNVDDAGRLNVVTSGGSSGGGGGFTADGGYIGQVAPKVCAIGSVEKVTSVGTSAVLIPAAPNAARIYMQVCNSSENPGTPIVKCRVDGVAPVLGIANAGRVLSVDDCLISSSDAGTYCISDTASTAVPSFECL